ncbi:MAG: hypothetical protein NDI61_09030 [Bdellovibrionaceae bacterium]|nr:hypothetical protein [Pseudobdellovibrionaceae bacterium]
MRHAFFDRHPTETTYLIAYQGGQPGNQLATIRAATQLDPRLIIWIDVQMTKDGTLIVFHDKTVPNPDIGAKPTLVGFATDASLGVGTQVPTLESAIQTASQNRLILNVREYRPGLDSKLIEVIEKLKATDRVLIQSDNDGLLRDVREQRGPWLFGTSQPQITQLLMLIPFALEPIAPLKGDVYITPFKRGETILVKPEVISEVHRRARKVFAGPVDSPNDVDALLVLHVDGIITAQPEQFLNILKR